MFKKNDELKFFKEKTRKLRLFIEGGFLTVLALSLFLVYIIGHYPLNYTGVFLMITIFSMGPLDYLPLIFKRGVDLSVKKEIKKRFLLHILIFVIVIVVCIVWFQSFFWGTES